LDLNQRIFCQIVIFLIVWAFLKSYFPVWVRKLILPTLLKVSYALIIKSSILIFIIKLFIMWILTQLKVRAECNNCWLLLERFKSIPFIKLCVRNSNLTSVKETKWNFFHFNSSIFLGSGNNNFLKPKILGLDQV
jgi:hypothetical protein